MNEWERGAWEHPLAVRLAAEFLQAGNHHRADGPVPDYPGCSPWKCGRRDLRHLSYGNLLVPMTDAHPAMAGIDQNSLERDVSVRMLYEHFGCIRLSGARLGASFHRLRR